MDLPTETLQQLLLRMTDPGLPLEARLGVAERVRERFPIEAHVHEYARIARFAPLRDEAASFVLRVLYVCARTWPERPEPKDAFRAVIGAPRSRALRTQAFIHLLLLDIDAAEAAARAWKPEMLVLVEAERRFPTLRRETPDAAFEEATLQLLFH